MISVLVPYFEATANNHPRSMPRVKPAHTGTAQSGHSGAIRWPDRIGIHTSSHHLGAAANFVQVDDESELRG